MMANINFGIIYSITPFWYPQSREIDIIYFREVDNEEYYLAVESMDADIVAFAPAVGSSDPRLAYHIKIED